MVPRYSLRRGYDRAARSAHVALEDLALVQAACTDDITRDQDSIRLTGILQ